MNRTFDQIELLNNLSTFHFNCPQILHYSIDYLIGLTKQKHVSIKKLSHKFGFSNPDEFENAVKCISNIYRQYSLEMIVQSELLTHFAHFNMDFQQSVLDVHTVRQTEVEAFLINEFNAQKNDLLLSFDWDVRQILGTSNSIAFRTNIATLILNCKTKSSPDQKIFYMELTRQRVDRLIEILEKIDTQMSNAESDE